MHYYVSRSQNVVTGVDGHPRDDGRLPRLPLGRGFRRGPVQVRRARRVSVRRVPDEQGGLVHRRHPERAVGADHRQLSLRRSREAAQGPGGHHPGRHLRPRAGRRDHCPRADEDEPADQVPRPLRAQERGQVQRGSHQSPGGVRVRPVRQQHQRVRVRLAADQEQAPELHRFRVRLVLHHVRGVDCAQVLERERVARRESVPLPQAVPVEASDLRAGGGAAEDVSSGLRRSTHLRRRRRRPRSHGLGPQHLRRCYLPSPEVQGRP